MSAKKGNARRGVFRQALENGSVRSEQIQNTGDDRKPQAFDGRFQVGRRRVLEQAESVPFRWPAKGSVADEYVSAWREMAGEALGRLKLSMATMETVASHVSRRDGTCSLSDKALSSRSGRSVVSTERDLRRLRALGFLIANAKRHGGSGPVRRALILSIPSAVTAHPRITSEKWGTCPSTYGGYVDGYDLKGVSNER